jgi:membrane-bound metal-dependent hydrolase YbcI (DUF457 family)
MDVGTHVLASFAAARALIPRAPWSAAAVVVASGTCVELDSLSAFAGPSAYLTWHHTYLHSLVASVAIGLLAALAYRLLHKNSPQHPISFLGIFVTVLLTEWLHLGMDACQSDGTTLLWPFNGKRIAFDWLSTIDPWILVVLLAAVLIPLVLQLVSSEIGAKEKQPHGQIGALIGLFVLFLSVGARAYFHSNAMGMLQNRIYNGEQPRHVAAFPETGSLLTWHGIVETERAFHEITVNAQSSAFFNPERGKTVYKPEESPTLEKARNTETARRFLSVARFPKASVQPTDTGYLIDLRDLRYALLPQTRHEVAALIHIGLEGTVVEQRLVWAGELRSK